MRVNTNNWISPFGEHCGICGSLTEACGDKQKCAEEAKLHIDEAIINGDTYGNRLLDVAYETLWAREKTAETFVGKKKKKA